MHLKKPLIIATVILLLVSCQQRASEQADKRLRTFVSIPPQAYFVERIGAPYLSVEVTVPAGRSPHSFEPTPKQVAKLSQADAYFEIGLPFEKRLLDKAVGINPALRIFDTNKGIELHSMDLAHEDADAKGLPDPHVWLSPRLAKIQARNIYEALCAVNPAHAAEFQKNLDAFTADLDRVNAEIAQSLAPLRGREFFVYHPSFWYFGDAYGLRQVAVEQLGKEPSARELAALIERAKADGVRIIFVQPQFPAKSAQAVAAAIGGSVVKIDDLSRDYLANLEKIAASIGEGLGTTSSK